MRIKANQVKWPLLVGLFSLFQAAFGSTFSAESKLINDEYKVWRDINIPSTSKKIPQFFKDATLEQLADKSKPTIEERKELSLVLQYQRELFVKYEAVISKYILPKEIAMEMIAFNRNILSSREIATKKLYDNEITFGEYVASMKSVDAGKVMPPTKQVEIPPIGIAEAKEKCINLGFKVNTEGLGKCVLRLSQ